MSMYQKEMVFHMSDCKWLTYNEIIIDKLESIIGEIDTTIYPLEELLEQLRFLKIKHQLEYLHTDISLLLDVSGDCLEYLEETIPSQKEHWGTIFPDSEYPKDIEWIQKKIQNDRNLFYKENGFVNLIQPV